MKKIIAIVMIVAFLFLPVAKAQEEINFEEEILPYDVNVVGMGWFNADVNLTIFLEIPEDGELNIDVYRQSSQVFGEKGIVGNFTTTRLIGVKGMHELRLYNTKDVKVTINGWWTINWNGTTTTTGTMPTGTTTTGNTTWTGDGPPPVMPDYLGIFLEVMVRYVIPVIVAVAIIALIFRKCRVEDFDYLVMFEDREILERQAEQEEERN